jgi:hypothetical protein
MFLGLLDAHLIIDVYIEVAEITPQLWGSKGQITAAGTKQ